MTSDGKQVLITNRALGAQSGGLRKYFHSKSLGNRLHKLWKVLIHVNATGKK